MSGEQEIGTEIARDKVGNQVAVGDRAVILWDDSVNEGEIGYVHKVVFDGFAGMKPPVAQVCSHRIDQSLDKMEWGSWIECKHIRCIDKEPTP